MSDSEWQRYSTGKNAQAENVLAERQPLVLLMVTMVMILRNKPQVTVIAAMMRRR